MKRFISLVLLTVLLCTVASADVFVLHTSDSYCVAYSYDGQHCLMMEYLSVENGRAFFRLYIQHADGSVSFLRDVEPSDPDSSAQQMDYAHVPSPAVSSVKVCGNMLLMYVYASEYRTVYRLVDMTTGEARSLSNRSVIAGIRGQEAVLALNAESSAVWRLDGNSGEMTQQAIPSDIKISALCPLSNGILLSGRDADGRALLWLDESGNVVHRLAYEGACENLYYDERTRTGIISSDSAVTSMWFNDHMVMQLLTPEINGSFETLEELLTHLDSNPLYVSLLPANKRNQISSYAIRPLGLTSEGTLLCTWNTLGWFCTLDLATMEFTPLLTKNDSIETVNQYARFLYQAVWNGGTRFCLASKLQPYQYIEIDHPALQ